MISARDRAWLWVATLRLNTVFAACTTAGLPSAVPWHGTKFLPGASASRSVATAPKTAAAAGHEVYPVAQSKIHPAILPGWGRERSRGRSMSRTHERHQDVGM